MRDLAVFGDYLGAILLLAGAVFLLISGGGLLRLRDPFSRMHAAAKPQWLGVFLLAAGAAISMRTWESVAASILMIVLQTISAPIGSQLMARAAYRNHEFEGADLLDDELARDNEMEEPFEIKRPAARGAFSKPEDYPDLDAVDEPGEAAQLHAAAVDAIEVKRPSDETKTDEAKAQRDAEEAEPGTPDEREYAPDENPEKE